MNDVGKKIAEYRISKGLNQSELARILGVTPQAVQKWEAGGAPRGDRLLKIAVALGVSVADLLGPQSFASAFAANTPVLHDELFSDAPKFSRKQFQNIEDGPDIRGRVPLISWIQAGAWSQIVDNFSPRDADDWMPCPSKYGPRTFALRVRGVSMEPKYQDGDIIFVDPDAEATHGKNIVVRLDDESEATFKQLVIEGEDKFLKPLNPDWPGPKLIQINGNATICGVVIGKWVPE